MLLRKSSNSAISAQMNARVTFASAYRQLQPVEKQFVDGYVTALEAAADQSNERISDALHRPVPPELIERSGGLLNRPLVTAAIAERVNDISRASELSIERVIRHLSAISFSSMQDYMTVNEMTGEPEFNLSNVTPDQWLAVKSVEFEMSARGTGKKTKVVLYDKLPTLFKYLDMFGISEPGNNEIRNYSAKQIDAAPNVPSSVTDLSEYYQRMLQESV